MSKQRSVMGEWVAMVLKELESYERGTILTYETIEAATGLTREHAKFQTMMSKVKGHMLKHRGIDLMAEANVGYKLCNSYEQLVDRTEYRQKRAKKQLSLGILAAEGVENSDLPPHLVRLKAAKIHDMNQLRSQISMNIKRQQLFERTEEDCQVND